MKTQTIKIEHYPATFEFRIRTNLPKFCNGENNFKYCEVRNKLLYKYLRKLKIYSPCHHYGDYVVERVRKTEDGEIWTLGS